MANISKDSNIINKIDLKEYALNEKKLSKLNNNTHYKDIKNYINSIMSEAINEEGKIKYEIPAGKITYDKAAQLTNVYFILKTNPNITLDKLKEKTNNNNFYESILNYYIAQDYAKTIDKGLIKEKEKLEQILKKNKDDIPKLKTRIIQEKDFIDNLNTYNNNNNNNILNQYLKNQNLNEEETKKYLEHIFDSLGLNINNGSIKSKNKNITFENLAKAYIILYKLKKIKENNRDSRKKNVKSEIELSIKTYLDNMLLQVYAKYHINKQSEPTSVKSVQNNNIVENSSLQESEFGKKLLELEKQNKLITKQLEEQGDIYKKYISTFEKLDTIISSIEKIDKLKNEELEKVLPLIDNLKNVYKQIEEILPKLPIISEIMTGISKMYIFKDGLKERMSVIEKKLNLIEESFGNLENIIKNIN